ncbi:hypothetical protein OPQ81_003695 [Rhizoctonia solani]|nr:hypothetical protein OPQ81_003695 [Rhizoctonia solani]
MHPAPPLSHSEKTCVKLEATVEARPCLVSSTHRRPKSGASEALIIIRDAEKGSTTNRLKAGYGSRNWSDRLASFIYTQELIWTFLRDFLLRQYSYGGNGPFLKATAAYKIPGEET